MRALLLVVLVLLAGCGGSVQKPETTTAEPITTAPETTREAPPDNPWQQDTVTVAVENRANESRDVTPLVRQTIGYWNGDGAIWADYSVTFELQPEDRENADLVVTFVENVTDCGIETHDRSIGCAPLLDEGTRAGSQETMEIEAGYTNESTVETMKHEFGHVLGIGHGEQPMPTMAEKGNAELLPQPDATVRAVPWEDSNLTVFVDSSNLTSYKATTFRKDLPHALEYFSSGADGSVPENVSVVEVNDRERADVLVTFPNEVECGGERNRSISCRTLWGDDTDSDDALEYYTGGTIEIASIHTHTMVWHLGYWLASLLGLERSELPSVFVDADYDERSSNWWEE